MQDQFPTVASMRQHMSPEVRAKWLEMLKAISDAKGTYFGPSAQGAGESPHVKVR